MVKVLKKNSTACNKFVSNQKENNLQFNNTSITQTVTFLFNNNSQMANEVPSTSGIHNSVTVLAVPVSNRITTTAPTLITKMTSTTQQQVQTTVHPQPSIHIAAPRLALHPLHPLGPIAIQANPNSWPIVEPVFHFGPGFEHQRYCPTHSQGPQPHEYVVFFHVNAGVSITFQIAGNREVIRGKLL